MILLLLVSILQQRVSLSKSIAKQNIVFRWAVYTGLLFSVLIFGMYGPEYTPASFIYAGF
jgi:hypothetical protein